MSKEADAIFQQVLDGILTTSLVKYAPPAPLRQLPKRQNFWRDDPRWQSSPGWSLTGRPPAPGVEDAPGPGHYHGDGGASGRRTAHRSAHKRPPSAVADGKRRRPSPESPPERPRGTPGPGAYDTARVTLALRTRSPTPVRMIPPKGRSPAAPPPTPGPGAYEAPAPTAGAARGPQRAIMGTTPRRPAQKAGTPGPGDYNPQQPAEAPRVPKWRRSSGDAKRRRSRSRRRQAAELVPGPGQYETQQAPEAQGGRGFSWCSASTGRQPVGRSAAPGPGSYEVAAAPDGPEPNGAEQPRGPARGWSFGTSIKPAAAALRPAAVPGPGAYDSDAASPQRQQRGAIIAPPPAPRSKEGGAVPGPGHYDTAGEQHRGGPAATIGTAPRGPRTPRRSRSNSPGPGAYDTEQGAERPRGFTFPAADGSSRRSRSAPPRPTPGPGAYDEAAPRAEGGPHFGTAPRKPRSPPKGATPGPGAYDASGRPVAEAERAHAFLKAPTGRQPEEAPHTVAAPGPGAYDVGEQAEKSRLGAVLLGGTEDRGLLRMAPPQAPGPGAYDGDAAERPAPGGVVAKARTGREPPRVPDDAPGPGQYDADPDGGGGGGGGGTVIGTAPRGPPGMARRESELRSKPGPGAYEPPRLAAGYGVRFPEAPRSPHAANPTPGPGEYDPASGAPRVESLAPGFGSAARADPAPPAPDGPGPGAYSAPGAAGGPAHSFGRAPRAEPEREPPPGPGAYEARCASDTRAATLGSAARPPLPPGAAVSVAPGPGAYDAARALGEGAKGPLLRGRPHSPPLDQLPGPGEYDAAAAQRGPAHRIGTAPRAPDPARDGPGPGAYEAACPPNGPAAEVTGRPPPAPPPDAPGPGAYSPADPRQEGEGAHRFGTGAARDFIPPPSAAPGPGAYELPGGSAAPAPSLGLPIPQPPPAEGPGPGAYFARDDVHPFALAAQHQGGAVGRAPRAHHAEQEVGKLVPGPGAYDGQRVLRRAPEALVLPPRGGGPRSDAPGPGEYDPQLGGPAAGAAIGTAPARAAQPPSETPGPGGYDPAAPGGGPQWSLAPRRAAAPSDPTPGPGAYAPPEGGAGEAVRIGTAPRPEAFGSHGDAPGPGAYDAAAPDPGVAFAFGSAPRGEAPARDGPGPGSYSVDPERPGQGPTLKGRDGPIIGMAAAGADAPGPGAYETQGSPQGPAVSFAWRHDQGAPPEGPGPGAYDAGDGAAPPAGGVVGTAPRADPFPARDGAGPGAYERGAAPGVGDGPMFTIGNRHVDAVAEPVPGPGSYDTRPPGGGGGGGAALGTAPRPAPFGGDAQAPGPGAYEAPALRAGPAAVLPSAPRLGAGEGGDGQGAPGPGHYEPDGAGGGTGPAHGFGTCPRKSDAAVAPPGDAAERPGPGAYSPTRGRAMGDGGPMPRIADRLPERPAGADGPGPGDYQVPEGGRGPRPPGVVVGSTAREPQWLAPRDAGQTPGPAAHEPPAPPPGPQHTIGAPRGDPPELRAAALRPGPGEYDSFAPPVGSEAPSAHLISRARPMTLPPGANGVSACVLQTDDAVPGPGQYDGRHPGKRVLGFDLGAGGERFPADAAGDSADPLPGPGEYDLPSALRDGPSARIVGRPCQPLDADGADRPGPGHYENRTRTMAHDPIGPKVSLAGKWPERDQPSDGPGPGAYHRPEMPGDGKFAATLMGRPPGWAGGAEKEGKADGPGPGKYHSDAMMAACAPEGQSAFIGTGREEMARHHNWLGELPDITPGPGRYHRNAEDFGADAPSALIGFQGRQPPFAPPVDSSQTPGPGAHHTAHGDVGTRGAVQTPAYGPPPLSPEQFRKLIKAVKGKDYVPHAPAGGVVDGTGKAKKGGESVEEMIERLPAWQRKMLDGERVRAERIKGAAQAREEKRMAEGWGKAADGSATAEVAHVLQHPKVPAWYHSKELLDLDKARKVIEPHSGGVVIGTAREPRAPPPGPGPASYDPTAETGADAPRPSFGSAARRTFCDVDDDDRDALDPDRGHSYLDRNQGTASLGRGASTRRSELQPDKGPAPGQYHTQSGEMGQGVPSARIGQAPLDRATRPELEEGDTRNYDVERAHRYLDDPTGLRGSARDPAEEIRTAAAARNTVHPGFADLEGEEVAREGTGGTLRRSGSSLRRSGSSLRRVPRTAGPKRDGNYIDLSEDPFARRESTGQLRRSAPTEHPLARRESTGQLRRQDAEAQAAAGLAPSSSPQRRRRQAPQFTDEALERRESTGRLRRGQPASPQQGGR
eukprot:TRINITY_DN13346_c0_g1_i3.p1 TRINITY_DN13346_c0_g1~~TRINITY_DN13346_c0_g1_i3.p1  ORF type:complete len:2270 (+),score=372.60 TRINITY_DN13346_c0_g1_i3:94-6810(+)